MQSFAPVDRNLLLQKLKKQGPILVSQQDTANLQVAPKRKSNGGPKWDPPPAFDSFVLCDLHIVGKAAKSTDFCTAAWIFVIHRKKHQGQGCFETLLLGIPTTCVVDLRRFLYRSMGRFPLLRCRLLLAHLLCGVFPVFLCLLKL